MIQGFKKLPTKTPVEASVAILFTAFEAPIDSKDSRTKPNLNQNRFKKENPVQSPNRFKGFKNEIFKIFKALIDSRYSRTKTLIKALIDSRYPTTKTLIKSLIEAIKDLIRSLSVNQSNRGGRGLVMEVVALVVVEVA